MKTPYPVLETIEELKKIYPHKVVKIKKYDREAHLILRPFNSVSQEFVFIFSKKPFIIRRNYVYMEMDDDDAGDTDAQDYFPSKDLKSAKDVVLFIKHIVDIYIQDQQDFYDTMKQMLVEQGETEKDAIRLNRYAFRDIIKDLGLKESK